MDLAIALYFQQKGLKCSWNSLTAMLISFYTTIFNSYIKSFRKQTDDYICLDS